MIDAKVRSYRAALADIDSADSMALNDLGYLSCLVKCPTWRQHSQVDLRALFGSRRQSQLPSLISAVTAQVSD